MIQSTQELEIVPGGKMYLVYAQDICVDKIMQKFYYDDQRAGATILLRNLSKPYIQVTENAREEEIVVLDKVMELVRQE